VQTNQSYQIHQDILGIVLEVTPRVTVMIPKGAIIRTVSGPVDGQRMIDIQWNNKVIMVFTQDLRDRGELIDGDGTSQV
jgi:hypothetical protein